MEERLPSEVRKRVLRGHGRLRERLHAMRHAAERMHAGEAEALRDLRDDAGALCEELLAHQGLEDQELAPILRDVPAFGEEWIEELRQYHADQRAAVTGVVERLGNPRADDVALADDVIALIDRLREDLVWEDRELAAPDLLKDDPVDVGFSG